MLKKIRIRGYQCHDDLTIMLDPKITAITGPSDAGKSAVLRAMRWVATNRPLGDSFIRYGSSNAVVRLWSDVGQVKRSRGNDNTYAVDGSVLEAFGADVPVDVFKVLKIDDVNFQGQHESPFWFALSPGEVAKQLNAIVDLSVIDDVMKDLGTKQRAAKAEVAVVEARLKEANDEYESTGWVLDLNKSLKRWEAAEDNWQSCKTEYDELSKDLDQYERNLESIDKIKYLIELGEEAVRLAGGVEYLANELTSLSDLIVEIEGLNDLLERPLPDIRPLEEITSRMAGARATLDDLQSLIDSYQDAQVSLDKIRLEVEECKEQLAAVKQCPLCGGQL